MRRVLAPLMLLGLIVSACGSYDDGFVEEDLDTVQEEQRKKPTPSGSCTIEVCSGDGPTIKDPFGTLKCDDNGCTCTSPSNTGNCDKDGKNCKKDCNSGGTKPKVREGLGTIVVENGSNFVNAIQ